MRELWIFAVARELHCHPPKRSSLILSERQSFFYFSLNKLQGKVHQNQSSRRQHQNDALPSTILCHDQLMGFPSKMILNPIQNSCAKLGMLGNTTVLKKLCYSNFIRSHMSNCNKQASWKQGLFNWMTSLSATSRTRSRRRRIALGIAHHLSMN